MVLLLSLLVQRKKLLEKPIELRNQCKEIDSHIAYVGQMNLGQDLGMGKTKKY